MYSESLETFHSGIAGFLTRAGILEDAASQKKKFLSSAVMSG